jgi:cell shape-determining protein MreD
LKRGLGLAVFGILAVMFQGAVAGFLPPGWCPDLGFLLVVAIGLCWRSTAGGLLLAALMGFVGDLLSGSLFGQLALLRVLAYLAARVASLHVNLIGPGPQVVFAAGLTVANALVLSALTAFFSPGTGVDFVLLRQLVPHVMVTALTAPFVTAAVAAIVARLGDDEASRRLLRLEPRNFTS